LPLVAAVAVLGVRTGRLKTDIAAALVGAAMLSVLLFPAIAGAAARAEQQEAGGFKKVPRPGSTGQEDLPKGGQQCDL